MRILVVDDDATYRQWLQALLESWDFPVRVATSGVEAMKWVEDGYRADLVLLDWDMPDADGFQVAQFLREREQTCQAYVLMITGSRNKQDLMRVLVSNADDYLTKPFDPMDLKIHVRTALRLLHLQQELEALRRRAPLSAPAGGT